MKKIYTSIFTFMMVFVTSACNLLSFSNQTQPTNTEIFAEIKPVTEEFYAVYFTDPESPNAESYRGGPDRFLAEAIRNARLSVDGAIHNLNLWSIRDALISAHESGVSVRLVVESDNLDSTEIQQVQDSGIPVLGDRRESRMHNKFVVIDGIETWTGSMNFTVTDGYLNNNNLIKIRSSRLAENYRTEFDEMFIKDMFGDNIMSNTPHPAITVSDTLIENYFSPDDGVSQHILRQIKEAQESIYFLAYSFTSDQIAAAMLERAAEGVTIAGVFEESQYYANTGTEYDRFMETGLDVRLDGNKRNMHHKVMIVDEKIVVLGSYNFSKSAEKRNDENVLIIHNPLIALLYLEEFDRIYTNSPVR
jgi:phosphatidylserine/phosphatidylglycerophosphate/cardiolipin synthase-like enzyme